MFLEVNSDKVFISIRNICSLKDLGLSSTPGILDESFISDILDQFQSIEILHLYGKFPYFNLDKLINLKQFILMGDIRENFNFELFKNLLNQLEVLFINITNIDYESLLKLFAGDKFSNLEDLYLTGCNIKRIEKKLIDKFPMLKLLSITECNLETIESDAFSNSKQLIDLDMSKNNFEKLENNFFSELINLEYFSMYENRLHFIEENVFSKLKNLNEIDLRYNNLSTFESFTGLGYSVNIYLENDNF